jgi:peroxiredoxin (alkyl hydroperoxide reductase subunit C)
MDRLPREAALAGCVVITNSEGAAKYASDVPIPSKFKFKRFDVDKIHARLKACLNTFEEQTALFEPYRAWIRDQEDVMDVVIDRLVDKLVNPGWEKEEDATEAEQGVVKLARVEQDLRDVLGRVYTTPVSEGGRVPDVVFKTRVRTALPGGEGNPFDWKDTRTADWFAGKRVVLFSLPGAFTPTCSSTHLPGYEAQYEQMKGMGVDDVYCLSVNDAFVMRNWGLAQGLEEDVSVGSLGFQKVKLLPDGACQFTRGMGMSCTWEKERGFGERSWR